MTKSEKLFERAKKVIPGGVNSPVRAFAAVGGSPRFIAGAYGATMVDADGANYLDYVGSWGPMILGHNDQDVLDEVMRVAACGLSFGAATELEVEMAELIVGMVDPLEMVRMVSSGTEAVMSAIRLARGFTGREKIIKFAGCYHGHSDSLLVAAGSGVLTAGRPGSDGVTQGAARDTLLAAYNDLDSVEQLFESNKEQVAAVIVEPAGANMGVVPPAEGFLSGLRALCDRHNALLIFDEVITGFRLAPGGAMEFFGVASDLATYGKIIGGGMPVGAYGGRREIMQCIAPVGGVYQAGTLSGNPVAMAAGLCTLRQLKETPQIYKHINSLAQSLAGGLRSALGCTVNQVGSLLCAFFTKDEVLDYESAKTSDTQKYAAYFSYMLKNGIYLAPSQFEAMFLSNTHTQQDIDRTIEVAKKFSQEETK